MMAGKGPDPAVPPAPKKGSLIVTVTNALGGAIISGAQVELVDTKTTIPTDTKGVAVFKNLAPKNGYQVKITKAGFGPIPAAGGTFAPGTVQVTANVKPGPQPSHAPAVLASPIALLKALVTKNDGKTPLQGVPVELLLSSGASVASHPTSPTGIADFGLRPALTPFVIRAGKAVASQVKPFQGPPNPPAPAAAVLGKAEEKKTLLVGESATVHLILEEKRLEILKIDDHFAPKVENLDIQYAIAGLSGRVVKLTVEGDNYPGKTLVDRPLKADETKDGAKNVIHWDGKIEVGGSKDGFVNPLMGPLRVRLSHDDSAHSGVLKSEKPFKLLYHSIEIKQGPFTPDEKEPPKANEKDWVQFKLNQLGFYGGPVGNDTDNYLKKAVIRYKANHKKFYQFLVANYNDSITADLKTAIAANDNSRPFLVGDPFSSTKNVGKVMVEELYYQRTGAGLNQTEFMSGSDRPGFDQSRVNRPLIPIEVTIFLKAKDNSKKLAAEAVGPLRINFRFKDANEDLSPQFTPTAASPSQTKKYVEAALKLSSGRTGSNGDNCPDTVGGLRKPGADASFDQPFLLGTFYKPYTTSSDAGQKVVLSTACVDKNFPLRVGKAGIYFRPSFIAGDDYQLRAEIDFTGLPNKATLESDHGATTVDKRIHVDTGVFRVMRFAKVAAVIDWPARANPPQFDLIRDEYAKSFIELDVSGFSSKTITGVLTDAEYKAVLNAIPTVVKPAGMALRASAYFGAATPAQGAQNAAAYKAALKLAAYTNFNDLSVAQMGDQICKKLRVDFPIGLVIINFFQHDPVDIQNNPAGGDTKVTKANTQFVTWGSSIGLADGITFMDMKDPDKVYYVVAHEMGHAFYLRHWENAGGVAINHDSSDHNCIMSYSVATTSLPKFQREGVYTPHFCGKCNLNLRGWDHKNFNMPAHS
jgi:hypothetical protein